MSTDISDPKQDWVLLQRQCKAFFESGFLPEHIKTPAQALTIAWKGHELGIPPLQAFSLISVIKGKPTLAAELRLALIYQRIPGAQITFLTPPEEAHIQCTVEAIRPGGKAQTFKFTLDDAKRAGLLGRGNWMQYPAAMLRAMAIRHIATAVFPDALMGRQFRDVANVEIDAKPEPEEAELVAITDGEMSTAEAAARAVDLMIKNKTEEK